MNLQSEPLMNDVSRGKKCVETAALARPPERGSVLRLFFATLREIFDEAAYARFLHRCHLAPSRQAYAAFLHEYEALKARRPKCC